MDRAFAKGLGTSACMDWVEVSSVTVKASSSMDAFLMNRLLTFYWSCRSKVQVGTWVPCLPFYLPSLTSHLNLCKCLVKALMIGSTRIDLFVLVLVVA
jgi:hypothetical protein